MFRSSRFSFATFFCATLGQAILVQAVDAGEPNWRVSKASGEAWITHSGVQPIALSTSETVALGDVVRTGANGRVLLTRGEENILLSPNSQIEVAPETASGFSAILQKAGSILLEVEKRNVQHFEVDTPFLAAVVKGTKFSVTVEDGASHVDVMRGQVEVRDYRTGQFALVSPDQAARASVVGPSGLSLTGIGTFNPIQQGKPGAPSRFAPSQPLYDLAKMPERRAEAAPGAAQNVLQNVDDAKAASSSERLAEATTNRPGAALQNGSHDEVDAPSIALSKRQQLSNTPSTSNGEAFDWTFGGVVKLVQQFATGGRHTNKREDDMVVMAIPAVVGLFVALSVGVARRRKSIRREKSK